MTETKTRFGTVIFPGFALLDVVGPIQSFNQLSTIPPFELSIITKNIDSISTVLTKTTVPESKFQSIGEQWLPIHTFHNAPELDILLI